jgi:membrane associated rhomboid family serine protease
MNASPAASLLLAAMVIASLIGLYGSPAMIERNLFRPYWLLRRREYLTPLTSAFLHADLAHLFFNGFSFWAFGFAVERAIGTPAFLALYFTGLVVSDIGTYVKHRQDPNYRCLGASGAILAVLFASIFYFPSASIYVFPVPVPIPAPIFAVAYLAYTYWAAHQGRGRVNHDAHLAGAVAGIAFVAITDQATFSNALHRFIN